MKKVRIILYGGAVAAGETVTILDNISKIQNYRTVCKREDIDILNKIFGKSSVMDIYKDCAHIQRTKPAFGEVTPAILQEIENSTRTLPTFEETLFNLKLIKHYSMNNNEFLRCRWQKYKNNIATKMFTPFYFPDHRDLHFHNGQVRFMKGYRSGSFGKKNIYGPGVDERGQMPIPFESFMKRGIAKIPSKKGRNLEKKKGDANEGGTEDKGNEANYEIQPEEKET